MSSHIGVTPAAHALKSQKIETLVDGMLLDGLLVLGFYNLLVGLIAARRSYFWYSLYLVLMAVNSTSAGVKES